MADPQGETIPAVNPFYQRSLPKVCLTQKLQHYLNPCHHYSRLIYRGADPADAKERAIDYEKSDTYKILKTKVLPTLRGLELFIRRDILGDDELW